MRLHVTLNNEDGAMQYSHDPYATMSGFQEHQQQQYYQPQQFPENLHHLQPPLQHFTVPPTAPCSADYGNNICPATPPPAMQTAPHHQHHYTPSPSLASNATGSTSSQSFYGGGSSAGDLDEVDSVNSAGGSSMNNTQSQSVCPSAGKQVHPMGTRADKRGHVDPTRFRTQPCARGEKCPYKPNCAFAHNEGEKRSRRRNVREGVSKVNTLPRTVVYHDAWVQTTKYTCKTGPSAAVQGPAGFMPSSASPVSVPTPSFKRGE